MREIGKEIYLPVVSGAYWNGLGGLTPEAEQPVDEEHIAAPESVAGSQKADEDTLVDVSQQLRTGN